MSSASSQLYTIRLQVETSAARRIEPSLRRSDTGNRKARRTSPAWYSTSLRSSTRSSSRQLDLVALTARGFHDLRSFSNRTSSCTADLMTPDVCEGSRTQSARCLPRWSSFWKALQRDPNFTSRVDWDFAASTASASIECWSTWPQRGAHRVTWFR